MDKEFEELDFDTLECLGEEETLDLEIDSEFHNYYANGICVSNSHAVSYSYLTMQTLFLKKYYPTEFYCALLNNQKGGSDKEKHKRWLYSAIQGAILKGIEVRKPSLNSGWEYEITEDNAIIMGFSSINGIGEKAYQEMIEKKFKNMTKDEFFSTKWTKFNKIAFEASVKAGVFDSWSESRDEINYWRELSKATSKKKRAEMEAENRTFEPTSEQDRNKEFFEVSMVDFTIMDRLIILQQEFTKTYGKPALSIMSFESPKEYYYFYLEKINKLKSKRGNYYYSLVVTDGIATKKLNMFDKQFEQNKHILSEGRFYVARFLKKDDFLNFDDTHAIREASL